MTTGWMKLHRTLLEKPLFEDAYTLQVLIYCLLKATYKEMAVRVGNQVIALQPGQLLYGRKQVSQRLGMGEGKLRGIMEYLALNGTITMESHSRYSIVTIVNWEQYQRGDSEPEFPFDCDFLDGEEEFCHPEQNETEQFCHPERNEVESKDSVLCCSVLENITNSQPHRNHPVTQSGTDFPDLDYNFSASREPQYNNINKYKNNNKQENKTKEFHCRPIAVYVDDAIAQQEDGDMRSQCDYLSGGGVTKGERMSSELEKEVYTDTSSEGLAALSMMDDAALEAYFSSCEYAAYDADMLNTVSAPVYDTAAPLCRPGHDFAAEMTCSLTEQDIAQLEEMFLSNNVGRSIPANSCEQLTFDTLAASNHPTRASLDELEPDEQEWIAAHQMFDRIWGMYPVKVGREKISDAQIMRLYEVGEKRMKSAIRQYKIQKKRVPKKYLMNGSTFFNGGYEPYLPAEIRTVSRPQTAGS